jgi:ATP-dependent Lon protease
MSNRKRSNNNEEINEIMKRPRLEEKDETVQKDDKSEEKSVDSSGEKSVDSSGEEKDDSDWHDGDDSFESELEFEEALCRLKDEEPILYDELKNIKDEISKTEPNIRKLLVTPLRLEDKVKLCQYYEIYKTQMPNTFDWLNTRNEYNKLYKEAVLAQEQYEKFTKKQHDTMKKEEDELKTVTTRMILKYKILNLNTSKQNKAVIYRRYEELMKLETSNEEYSKLSNWLECAVSMPYDNVKKIKMKSVTKFIKLASKKLDETLYGMKNVKEQILLYLSAKLMNPNMKKTNLGLIGPPGVGKTSIARLISEIMDWGFEQISFGGIDRSDFLKGHEYTYVGAQPGAIVKALQKMGHKNGILFLDELEKISKKPDITAALLHLVDQTQNSEFKDNYLGDISIDLSKIWFIGSMNNIPTDSAFADRWWIIRVNGYRDSEKKEIIKSYLLPKALKNMSQNKKTISFTEKSLNYLINSCDTGDRGVRDIKKKVDDVVNKICFILTHQNKKGKLPYDVSFKLDYYLEKPVSVTEKLLRKFLKTKELNYILKMMYL